jgi:hypothetical protein
MASHDPGLSDADPSDFLFRRELGEKGNDRSPVMMPCHHRLMQTILVVQLFSCCGLSVTAASFLCVTHSSPHQIIYQSSSISAGALAWSVRLRKKG